MMKKLKGLFMPVTALMLVVFSAVTVWANKPLIYVSGNPDCYPIEYFDDKGEYKGYIPALLSQFGEEYGYKIEYLSKNSTDNRKTDLKNAQAEIISGVMAKDFSSEQIENGIAVFCADEKYYIIFSEAADQAFKNQLKEFFSKLTPEQANSVLLSVTSENPDKIPTMAVIILSVVAILLLGGVITLIVRLKKYRKAADNKDTDIITGLGNYLYLEEYFNQFLTDKNRSLYCAVYFEAYLADGIENRNAFLKTLATVLNAQMGDTDILARIDDGFFVLKNLSEKGEINAWVEAVLEKLRAEAKEKKEFKSAIMTGGIYNLGTHDRDLDKMISNAAYCCRYARKNKKLYSVYSVAIEKAEKEEDQLREDIKSAFEKDEFTAYLQFFVHAENRQILGAEALSRWNHPAMGVLKPARYIDLLEKENMLQELDFAILRQVCETLEEICKKTEKAFFIAFNFSRSTLVMPDFVKRVEDIVSEFHFPRECLLLEVTEYTRVSDSRVLFDNINSIKKLGIKVVIDDFGSGFTDLIDIGKCNFDGVKLDKSLIDGEHTEADDIILKSLINLMHELRMTVIAEGIEKEEQATRLLKAGCMVIQGFYYYLPMPKLEAMRILLK